MTTAKRLDNPRGKIIKAIRDTVRARGYPPSIKEIGEIVGLSSTSSVQHHLRALQRAGLIERVADSPRAIVVRTPPDALFDEIKAALEALDKGFVGTARQILAELVEDLGGKDMPADHTCVNPQETSHG